MLKRPEAEGAYIEDEEELVKAVEGIELGECCDFDWVFGGGGGPGVGGLWAWDDVLPWTPSHRPELSSDAVLCARGPFGVNVVGITC